MTQEKTYCPRGPGPGTPFQAPFDGEMTWEERGSERVCSYCGGLHPEDALRLLADGVSASPTDKNYKLYIGNHKFYFQHMSSEQQDTFIKLHNDKKMNLAFPGRFYVTPYFCAREPAKPPHQDDGA